MDQFLDGPWAYALLFLFAFGENAVGLGLFFPVDTLIIGAASLCAVGTLSTPVVLACVFVGALAGDSLGYLIGRRFGPTLTRRLVGHLGITEARIEQARSEFERRGMWAVAIGRVIPVLRLLVILLAGDLGLPYRKFLLADALGITAWVAFHFTLGYALGSSVKSLGGESDLLVAFAAVAVLGLASLLALRWWSVRRMVSRR